MSFFVRNLDVDNTRFNVMPVKSQFVRVQYNPGFLAPGVAAKIVVEIAASAPATIEQLVEVKIKAHVIKVPVTALVHDAEEYDKQDEQMQARHRTRLGRPHERSENNKP